MLKRLKFISKLDTKLSGFPIHDLYLPTPFAHSTFNKNADKNYN